jgi:predicted NUDIX family NTP pyrophosphohydrolase
MSVLSAGLLLYRQRGTGTEVFLVHPGGPFWSRKDAGSWSIPKGLLHPGEEPLAGAQREFAEETGLQPGASGRECDLGSFRLPSGKQLQVFMLEGDCDPSELKSNLFEMEWPPHSGRRAQFPEVDRGGWFDRSAAQLKITAGQRPVLERFFAQFCARGDSSAPVHE